MSSEPTTIRAVPGEQAAEVPITPPRWLIPWLTRLQVFIYELSRGWLMTNSRGMPHIIVRGIRRRSGKKFAVCLPYWVDARGQRIVVASYAGAEKNPSWYHNLKDTTANPTVYVRDARHVFTARAEVLAGDERERVWAQLVEDRPFYARYQERTGRKIPLVRVVEGA